MSRHTRWGFGRRRAATSTKSPPANLVILAGTREFRPTLRWFRGRKILNGRVPFSRGLDRAIWRAQQRKHRDGYLAGGVREAEKAALRGANMAMRRQIAKIWAFNAAIETAEEAS